MDNIQSFYGHIGKIGKDDKISIKVIDHAEIQFKVNDKEFEPFLLPSNFYQKTIYFEVWFSRASLRIDN